MSPFTAVGWIFIAASLFCSVLAFRPISAGMIVARFAIGFGIAGFVFALLGILDGAL